MLTTTTPEAPVPDGDWQYALLGADSTLYTDSLTDVVGAVIDGYSDLGDTDSDHDEALAMRYDHTVRLAQFFQASVNSASAEVIAAMSDDELGDVFASKGSVVVSREWTSQVPLFLVATDYAPFTARPAPTGNVVLLDPSTEMTFVQALVAFGLVELVAKHTN